MRITHLTTIAFTLASLMAGPAFAGTCRTEHMTCATGMPVDGYCECTAHRTTEGGTVIETPSRRPINSTAAGCGAHPNAAGCR